MEPIFANLMIAIRIAITLWYAILATASYFMDRISRDESDRLLYPKLNIGIPIAAAILAVIVLVSPIALFLLGTFSIALPTPG